MGYLREEWPAGKAVHPRLLTDTTHVHVVRFLVRQVGFSIGLERLCRCHVGEESDRVVHIQDFFNVSIFVKYK